VAAVQWTAGARGVEVVTAGEAIRHGFRLTVPDVPGQSFTYFFMEPGLID